MTNFHPKPNLRHIGNWGHIVLCGACKSFWTYPFPTLREINTKGTLGRCTICFLGGNTVEIFMKLLIARSVLMALLELARLYKSDKSVNHKEVFDVKEFPTCTIIT